MRRDVERQRWKNLREAGGASHEDNQQDRQWKNGGARGNLNRPGPQRGSYPGSVPRRRPRAGMRGSPAEASGMRKHVELVGVLYFVWGSLFVLIGVAFLALAFGSAAIATSSEGDRSFAAGITAATFAGLAAVSLIWGLVHIWDAVAVRHCRELGRAIAMVLAVLNLFLLPVGTALGIYTLWVLTQDETRPLFESARGATLPPG